MGPITNEDNLLSGTDLALVRYPFLRFVCYDVWNSLSCRLLSVTSPRRWPNSPTGQVAEPDDWKRSALRSSSLVRSPGLLQLLASLSLELPIFSKNVEEKTKVWILPKLLPETLSWGSGRAQQQGTGCYFRKIFFSCFSQGTHSGNRSLKWDFVGAKSFFLFTMLQVVLQSWENAAEPDSFLFLSSLFV